MIPKLFISYSKENIMAAEAIFEGLTKPDQIIFLDRDKIKAGEDYEEVIEDNIKTCDYFVLLWSLAAAESVWVNKEIVWAREYERNIVPFFMDACPPHPLLRKVHHKEWQTETSAIKELLEIIKPRKEELLKSKERKFIGHFSRPPFCRPSLYLIIYDPSNEKSIAVDAVIDTAADHCAIPYDLAYVLGVDIKSRIRQEVFTLAGRAIFHQHKVKFILNDTNNNPYISNEFLAYILPKSKSPMVGHVIIGIDFLKDFEMSFNYAEGYVVLRKLEKADDAA